MRVFRGHCSIEPCSEAMAWEPMPIEGDTESSQALPRFKHAVRSPISGMVAEVLTVVGSEEEAIACIRVLKSLNQDYKSLGAKNN